MCDLYSWGILNRGFTRGSTKFHKGQILFLTDDEAETLHQDLEDCVGHSAIAEYYGIFESAFEHRESLEIVPAKIYKEIQAGHLRKMVRAVNPMLLKLTYHRNGPNYVIDEDNQTWCMKSPEYDAVFDACRNWLDANHPGMASSAMPILLDHRNARMSDFNGRVTADLPEPRDVVTKLLHWSRYSPELEDIFQDLHDFIQDTFPAETYV